MHATILGGLHGMARLRLKLLDQLMNLTRGTGRSLGKLPDFIGDHREAAATFTGTRSLDRGVECQQVGLVGDALDHIDHAADCLAVVRQLVDRLARLRDGFG